MSDIQQIVNNCTTMLKEDFSEEECVILSDAFKLRKLDADEILLREGEKDDALSIVIDGDILVSRDAGGGEQVTLHHLKAGDVAGAMGFIDGNSHTATLRASRPTHVMTLPSSASRAPWTLRTRAPWAFLPPRSRWRAAP